MGEEMANSSAPPPKNLHEAAMKGDVKAIQKFFVDAEGGPLDINAWDDRQIAPLGYAVACGHSEAVRWFVKQGADLKAKDGQDNTFFHYAAGYGHLDILEELIQLGEEQWKNDAWAEARNKKGQSVVDAARVNRKGKIVDFLNKRLGYAAEAEVIEVDRPAEKQAQVIETTVETDSETSAARAALLAAMRTDAANPAGAPGVAAAPTDAAPGEPTPQDTAAAVRKAVDSLKQNPEAVEKAKAMMAKMPPQFLSMLSGNKMSSEQAQKAMDAMQKMSTEEFLKSAEVSADQLGVGGGASAAPTTPRAASAASAKPDPAPAAASAARVVD